MTWFRDLTGIDEPLHDPRGPHAALHARVALLDDDTPYGKLRFPNGRVCQHGRLEHLSLRELRALTGDLRAAGPRSALRELVGDVGALHADPAHRDALFQVASQLNLLEMVDPQVTPERGVTGYIHDRTQGPTCALAAAAGTLYRNYFVEVEGPRGPQRGQTADAQLNGIHELGVALGNEGGTLWSVQNGYLIPKRGGLERVYEALSVTREEERDRLRGLLRVGAHWDTEVTRPDAPPGQRVQQVYCSALPISYAGGSRELWEPFARLVLEATYEHTLRCAALNKRQRGASAVYLTYVGGGVFGNPLEWILDALYRALREVEGAGLDVVCVSYGASSPQTRALVRRWQEGFS